MQAKVTKFLTDLQDTSSGINVLELYSELTKYKDSPRFYDRLDTIKFCKAFIQCNPNAKFTTVERYFRAARADMRLKDQLNNHIPTINDLEW